MASVFESSLVREQFDAYRQNVWKQYVSLHDATWTSINNRTITAEQLQLAISRLNNLLVAYRQYYDSVRSLAGADWIDSRFHDYFDPMQRTLTEWNTRIAQIPSVTVTQPSTAPSATTPLTNGALPSLFSVPGFGPVAPVSTNGQAYAPEWAGTGETAPVAAEGTVNYWPWLIGGGLLFLLLRK